MTTDDRARAIRGLETEFGDLFARTRRLFQAAAERVLPGMPPATYRTLTVISHRGPVTASALAEAMTLDKGQLSRMVKDLSEAGLVHAEADPSDRRARVLSVTDLGRERLESARAPMRAAFASALATWEVAEIDAFAEMLHTLLNGLTADQDDAAES